jgi:hypothetical protein
MLNYTTRYNIIAMISNKTSKNATNRRPDTNQQAPRGRARGSNVYGKSTSLYHVTAHIYSCSLSVANYQRTSSVLAQSLGTNDVSSAGAKRRT